MVYSPWVPCVWFYSVSCQWPCDCYWWETFWCLRFYQFYSLWYQYNHQCTFQPLGGRWWEGVGRVLSTHANQTLSHCCCLQWQGTGGGRRVQLEKGENCTDNSGNNGHRHSAMVDSQQPTLPSPWCFRHSVWGQCLPGGGSWPIWNTNNADFHPLTKCPPCWKQCSMAHTSWPTCGLFNLHWTEWAVTSNWWTVRWEGNQCYLCLQYGNQLLEGHQSHAHPSIHVSSSSHPQQQADGGGRVDWLWRDWPVWNCHCQFE